MHSVRLTGMGPKLLLSDISTRDQPVLRWRLRVRGNTAVEFGVVPADLPPCHTALHKCMAEAGAPHQRATGFCSQVRSLCMWGAENGSIFGLGRLLLVVMRVAARAQGLCPLVKPSASVSATFRARLAADPAFALPLCPSPLSADHRGLAAAAQGTCDARGCFGCSGEAGAP